MGKTLFDKIWEKHVVRSVAGGPDVLYIDHHLIHEVTSPVAFLGLEKRGLKVFRPEKTVATPDHNVPTEGQHLTIQEDLSRHQVDMQIMKPVGIHADPESCSGRRDAPPFADTPAYGSVRL